MEQLILSRTSYRALFALGVGLLAGTIVLVGTILGLSQGVAGAAAAGGCGALSGYMAGWRKAASTLTRQ